MLTSFGRQLRYIRRDNYQLLKDMAGLLNVSSSYLSAVEMGKRNVPEGWPDKIGELYKLDAEYIDKLKTFMILDLQRK